MQVGLRASDTCIIIIVATSIIQQSGARPNRVQPTGHKLILLGCSCRWANILNQFVIFFNIGKQVFSLVICQNTSRPHQSVHCISCVVKLADDDFDLIVVSDGSIHFLTSIDVCLLKGIFLVFKDFVFASKFINNFLRLFIKPIRLILLIL